MSYRGYRFRYHSYSYSKYSHLQSLLGDAVNHIRRMFLAFPADAIEELLRDYASVHGDGAAKYARQTLPKWRAGTTQMSGQTMERLIELTPPYLSAGQRHELLLEVVRKHKTGGQIHHIFVNRKEPAEGLRQVNAALESLRHKDALAHIPRRAFEAAKWLYDDDITVARAMLAQADKAETELVRASAEEQLAQIRLLVSSGQVQQVNYNVAMPTGRLRVAVGTKSWCFVATVCFGEEAWQTQALRGWRDRRLVKCRCGRAFAAWYGQHGAALAHLAQRYPVLLSVARLVVGGVAWLVRPTRDNDTSGG